MMNFVFKTMNLVLNLMNLVGCDCERGTRGDATMQSDIDLRRYDGQVNYASDR